VKAALVLLFLAPVRVHVALLSVTSSPPLAALVLAAETGTAAVALVPAVRAVRRSWPRWCPAWIWGGVR
jgi:hypothetical protein